MSWLNRFTGKAETCLLDTIDEGAGSLLNEKVTMSRNRNIRSEFCGEQQSQQLIHKNTCPRRSPTRSSRKPTSETKNPATSPKKNASKVFQKNSTIGFSEAKGSTSSPQRKLLLRNRKYNSGSPFSITVPPDKFEMCIEEGIQNYEFDLEKDFSCESSKKCETGKLHSLEIENELLKTELDTLHKEVTYLNDNVRFSEKDQAEIKEKLTSIQREHTCLKEEKQLLELKLDSYKINAVVVTSEEPNLPTAYKALNEDYSRLQARHIQLQEQLKEYELTKQSMKLEHQKMNHIANELEISQKTIKFLQNEVDSHQEVLKNARIEWDAYRGAIECDLVNKDQAIAALKNIKLTEDEKTALYETIQSFREQHEKMECKVQELTLEREQLQERAREAQRLVSALRDALQDERDARSSTDHNYNTLQQDYKTLQENTSIDIAKLSHLLEEHMVKAGRKVASFTSASRFSSALNVSDERERGKLGGDSTRHKVQQLTQALLVKQARIDTLVTDHNVVKSHLENVENKYRNVLQKLQNEQKIVQILSGKDGTKHQYVASSAVSQISVQVGIFLRRHPIFRLLILIYMAGLHLWVFVVLLTYSPEHNSF